MRDRAPPYPGKVYLHAPRLVALRGGDRNEKTPQTDSERGVLMRRAHFYPQHWLLCHVGLYLFEFEFAAPSHVHSAHAAF